MDIKDFLSERDVMTDVRAPDKTRLLRDLSRRAASSLKLDADVVSSEILKRETLGSTGMGGGVAIPHARIQGLEKPFGILARLRKGMEFEAVDNQPVDIVFLVLLPAAREREQLNALASVARKLRDEKILRGLRDATDSAALFATITSGQPPTIKRYHRDAH
jgi:PTS system nitrogen regulatory IIA component